MVEKKIESNPLDQKVFQQLMELFINAEIYPSGNWRQYSYKAMLAAEAAL